MSILLAVLLLLALATAQVLFGGADILAYSLPAVVIGGAAAVLSVFAIRSKNVRAADLCLCSVILCFGYIVFRAWISPVEYLARHDITVVGAALIVYLITALYVTSPKIRLAFVAFFLVMAVIQVGIGSIQYTREDNFMLIPLLPRPDYGARISGFYACPNHLAGFLEVAALFGLSAVLWSRWPIWAKVLVAWATLLSIAGQMLTGSRGGYLSLTAAFVVFTILSLYAVKKVARHRFWLAFFATVVAGCISALAVAFMVMQSDLVRQRVEMIADTGNMRLTLWQGALQQFQLAPLLGTGSGTYLFYGRFFLPSTIWNDPRYVHNDYLHLLAEYGVIGACMMAIFIAVHLWTGWKSFSGVVNHRLVPDGLRRSNGVALQIGALSSVAAYAVHSVVDFNLHLTANAMLMAFVFGILASAGVSSPEMPLASFWSNLFGRLALPVIGLVALILCAPLLRSEYYSERARAALELDHYGDAIQFAQQGLLYDRRNPELYYYLGWSKYMLSQTPVPAPVQKAMGMAAAESLRSGIKLFPQDTRLHLALGFTLRDLRQFEEAELAYLKAIEWDPNSAILQVRYSELLAEKGDLAGARASLERSMALSPNIDAMTGLQALEEKAVSRDNNPVFR